MPLIQPWESAAIELFRRKADTRLLKEGTKLIKKACLQYADQYLEEIMKHLEKKVSSETLQQLAKELKAK